ncbi:MAG: ATP-binding protein, partial [Opitutales bacterium]
RQLLDLVVHSLYTDKEIFLRELISNASDAMEKLRHIEATEKDVHSPGLPVEIHITTDKDAGTLTIADHGIGMNHGELVENLGTIAHSGTKAFLQALKETGKPPGELIGQFGVGFYSAFMVADKVVVVTRKAGGAPDSALRWESDGSGTYTVEETTREKRGTDVILHLKE